MLDALDCSAELDHGLRISPVPQSCTKHGMQHTLHPLQQLLLLAGVRPAWALMCPKASGVILTDSVTACGSTKLLI